MKIEIFGNNRNRIPDMAFRVMSCMFVLRDRLMSPWSVLDEFGIERGRTVVDYGWGPGSYLRRASELVGPEGRVFAVDTHGLAMKAVMRRTRREGLCNVTAVLADGNRRELNRICTTGGGALYR